MQANSLVVNMAKTVALIITPQLHRVLMINLQLILTIYFSKILWYNHR